jgi:hypothetical protein
MIVPQLRCTLCVPFAIAALAVSMSARLVPMTEAEDKTAPGPALAQMKMVPKVKVAPAGWALHGHVYNAHSQPVAGFSVFLVDVKGRYLPQFGNAYTDDSGYFLLNYAGGNRGASAPPRMFIEVANASSTPVFLGSTPFLPTPGGATYQSITIPDSVQPGRNR